MDKIKKTTCQSLVRIQKQMVHSYIASGNASGIIMLENHLAGSTKGKQNKSKVHHFSSWVYPQKMEICPSKDLNKSLRTRTTKSGDNPNIHQ